jgi:hypothetical protein
LVYDGWVEGFSDDCQNVELFLRDVDIYRNSTNEALYQVGALYITLPRDQIFIEFRGVPIDESLKWKESHNGEGQDSQTEND